MFRQFSDSPKFGKRDNFLPSLLRRHLQQACFYLDPFQIYKYWTLFCLWITWNWNCFRQNFRLFF